MILRKPYAFLIKNFKLIHAVMTIFMAYIFYKTWSILSVFNAYFNSGKALIGTSTAAKAYPFLLFLLPVLIIILSLILFGVMAVKKKPSSLYIITIVMYIYSIVMFSIGRSTMLDMEINVLDIRLIKMARDLTTIAFILQIYPLFKSLVRATGFDIKEFDFGKDLAELEIEEADNEEFEVNVSLNTNKVKRGLNFRKRELKYILLENKMLIILAILIVFVILSGITLFIVLTHDKANTINQLLNVSGLNVKVTNAYITRKDYKGNTLNINDEMSLVIIPINIKNNSDVERTILPANIMLDIDEHRFRNSITYRDSETDLGNIYTGDMLKGNTTENRILIFEVPTNYLKNKMELKFISSISSDGKKIIPSYVTVDINPIDLDNNIQNISVFDGEYIDLSRTILGNSVLNINSSAVAKRFKIEYKNKIANDEAMNSYEYIYAPLDTNVDKSLLKISGVAELNNNTNIKDLYDIINTYGSIRYKVGDTTKNLYTLSKVNPSVTKSSNTLYIGVPSEMEKASEISLILKIRNKEYTYKIK